MFNSALEFPVNVWFFNLLFYIALTLAKNLMAINSREISLSCLLNNIYLVFNVTDLTFKHSFTFNDIYALFHNIIHNITTLFTT